MSDTYGERVRQEVSTYKDVENVHDLPSIFDHWNQRFLLPRFEELGFASSEEFFLRAFVEQCAQSPDGTVDMVSLGSGNGDFELRMAGLVRNAGYRNFRMTRLELNDAMRARARADAESAGLDGHFEDVGADLNVWEADRNYGLVLANHSLHHVVELEHLFDQVRSSLLDDGIFVVNDMIGRNGHMRWPEALLFVERIWAAMPDRYRYNHQLGRHEQTFVNWDCSVSGFEGIRAQDILPLLGTRFHPEVFLAFANMIDIFIDRSFGHNFDPELDEDRTFIDEVAQLDSTALALGVVKPTHLMAWYRRRPTTCRYPGNMSPTFALRPVEADPEAPGIGDPASASEAAQGSEAEGAAAGPVVSVVLHLEDGVERTIEAITALARRTPDAIAFETLIVDDATTDQTAEFLQALSGDLNVVRNDAPLGYGPSVQRAVERARASVVVLLDQYTVVSNGWLEPLLARLDADPQLAAVQPFVLRPFDLAPRRAGSGPDPQSKSDAGAGEGPGVTGAGETAREILDAACVVIRKDILIQTADPQAAHPDAAAWVTHLTRALHGAGYATRCEPWSVVIHHRPQ